MDIKKVVVCGGGVLGAQIALQVNSWGFDTTMWLRSEGSIGRAKPRLERYTRDRKEDLKKMRDSKLEINLVPGLVDSYEDFNYDEAIAKVQKAYDDLTIETDMEKAFEDCDLIIESMTENLEQKKDFYHKAKDHLPEKTIICTNSSSLLPSSFMEDTGRPEKFLTMHFANSIHRLNMVEIMRTSKTGDQAFETVVNFAKAIRMVPIKLKKEKAAYLLNSLSIPFLISAGDLLATGIADVEDIDNAWKLGTGAPRGPFEMYDKIGLKTPYDIYKDMEEAPEKAFVYDIKGIQKILKEKIDEGHIGIESGEGFYKYDENGKKID